MSDVDQVVCIWDGDWQTVEGTSVSKSYGPVCGSIYTVLGATATLPCPHCKRSMVGLQLAEVAAIDDHGWCSCCFKPVRKTSIAVLEAELQSTPKVKEDA